MGNASVQRGLFLTFGLFSLIRHALRRATFPVGEGDLRRGSIHRGPAFTFRCPLHTRRRGGTLSKQERAGDFPLGRLPPAGDYRLLVMLPFGYFSRGSFHRLLHSCGKGLWWKVSIHKNTPQLFYKLWRNFPGFPGGSGGGAGERGCQFASFTFFSSYIQVYPQSFPGFPQNLSTAVDTAVDKFKSLFEITCSGRHRWLRHPSYRHPWPG